MRTFWRLMVALIAWLMLAAGAASAMAQPAPAPGAVTMASPPQALWSPAPSWRIPDPRPPFPGSPWCPATGTMGSRTDRPLVPFEAYFLHDWRLGPAALPRTGPVAALLNGYRRTDALTPGPFIACYWDPSVDNNQGGWRYPANNGFAGGTVAVTLRSGQFLDRFGANTGRFLAPYGVDYSRRALPPSNLDTFEARYPNNYHVFRVLRPFTVDGGTAAPWFGQPGGGIQYLLQDAYFPGEVMPPDHVNTQWLIMHQYLQAIN
jgi:nicrotizing toxin Mtb-like protein